MVTITAELPALRRKLHDSGALWTDAELTRWYLDGYRELLARSQAVRRWVPLDVPGRHTYALTQDWEDAHVSGALWKPFHSVSQGNYQASGLWEVEALSDIAPGDTLTGLTQEWERDFVTTDRHYRFSFLRDHTRLIRLMWQNRRLDPVSVRELDQFETAWEQEPGTLRLWTEGTGRIRSVETFEIEPADAQAYDLRDPDAGLPRQISGDRTYTVSVAPLLPQNAYAYTTAGDAQAFTLSGAVWIGGLGAKITTAATTTEEGTQVWEADLLDGAATLRTGQITASYVWEEEFGGVLMTLAVGGLRRATSPDRQYLPVGSDGMQTTPLAGRIVDWRSSSDTVLALEAVVPRENVQAADAPLLIPDRLQKYVRYYVWARAFGRAGEGRAPLLAQHYAGRFDTGVRLLRRVADIAHRDRVWIREDVSPRPRRPARVRLPAEFPAVS